MSEPNRGLLGPLEDESGESWFERCIEPWLDRILRFLEFLTVTGLAIIVMTGAIYEALWVLWGSVPSGRQSRMQSVLGMLDQNWKVGLLLLIPLFYRTVRAFLQRAEEFAGIKAPREPVRVRTGKLPPQRDSQSKEG